MASSSVGSRRRSTLTSGKRYRPAFDIVESKLRPPPVDRPDMVSRTVPVDRLLASAARVISVIAPPGYGKTTLLAQWGERCSRPLAWVSLDGSDNDLSVMLTYVAVALDRVEPLDSATLRSIGAPSAWGALHALPGLASAVSRMSQPVSLVVDHVEALHNGQCLDAIAELALHLPVGAQVAFAAREAPTLPTALLRSRGELEELGPAELAMNEREAGELLAGVGVDLAPADLSRLMRRTEGWPVGLYLAGLAIRAGGRHDEPGLGFSGDDVFMADYLRSEILDRSSSQQVSFLTRTAVLDRLSGPLCDAVLDETGSGDVLETLVKHNLLLIPLDRRREWFRYHHLLRDMLLHELARKDGHLVGELHSRASSWHEANDLPETAIEHAQAAGDTERVAGLILKFAQPVWASGRVDTVVRWMEWLEGTGSIEAYPEVAVHGALIFALLGKTDECDRWSGAAERGPSTGILPDGSTTESYLAYMRAILCRHEIDEMRRDAEIASKGLSAESPYRPTMLHVVGLFHQLEGDLAQADELFGRAYDGAIHVGSLPFAALILVGRCLIAVDRGDWAASRHLTARAEQIVEDGAYDGYFTSALVYAWLSRAALHRGDAGRAREYVVRAARLRPMLTYALPVLSLQSLVELARSYLAFGDTGGAASVIDQAKRILRSRPELVALQRQVDDLTHKLDVTPVGKAGGSSLTPAELRLVPFMATHLTLNEIAQRLFVSRTTVKTQVSSIYRKLGVSSRNDAIEHMKEMGLIGS